jgi:hypothetical protein
MVVETLEQPPGGRHVCGDTIASQQVDQSSPLALRSLRESSCSDPIHHLPQRVGDCLRIFPQ